jgi:hypothetical protein
MPSGAARSVLPSWLCERLGSAWLPRDPHVTQVAQMTGGVSFAVLFSIPCASV